VANKSQTSHGLSTTEEQGAVLNTPVLCLPVKIPPFRQTFTFPEMTPMIQSSLG